MTQKGKQLVSKRTSIVKLWPIWPLKGELAWFTVIRGYGKKSNDAVKNEHRKFIHSLDGIFNAKCIGIFEQTRVCQGSQ